MTRSHILSPLLPVVIGYCCWAAAARGAEEAGGAKAPDGLHADTTYTDVYVNDSFEAADAIARAQALAARRKWSEAAQVLQETSDAAGDKLVRVSSGHYVGVREHVNRLIADWPEAGIAAYRRLFERQIQASLPSPAQSRTVQSLLPLFDRYFCTVSAAKLADAIAQLAIESGDLSLAQHVYRRMLEDHPDQAEYAPHCRAMLAVIAAMRGDGPAGGESPPSMAPGGEGAFPDSGSVSQSEIRWMGQDVTVSDALEAVRDTFPSLRTQVSPWEWPIFGGNAQRNRRTSSEIQQPGLLWRFDGLNRRGVGTGDELAGESAAEQRNRARHLSIQPVVSGGLVFAQLFRDIVALHRNTGAVAWRFRAEDTVSEEFNYLDEQPPGWDSVTVHEGRVYVSLPGDAVPYYSYESARSPPELVCLDGATGGVIWRVDQQMIEEAFAEIMFDSSPIVEQGRLHLVGRRRRSFGFEDCYLYRFNAATGKLEHRTHLGSASTGTLGSRRATKAVAAMHNGTVYVCTNLGSVVAVSAQTGAVRWLRLYGREPAGSDREGGPAARDVKPWQFGPVIWSAGRILVLPTDTAAVLMFDAHDGRLLRSLPVENVGGLETILGVQGSILCGAGREVACYNLETDALLWSTPLPDDADLYGRGVWASDRLLVPTRKHLCVFRADDGQRSEVSWDADGEGGNLLAMPDQMLVAGAGRLSAFVRKADILKTLRDRMAAASDDPLPALELAEIALSNGEFSEAVGVLDEAVRRTHDLRQPLDPALGRRLFDDTLMFVDRLPERSTLDADILSKLFAYASQFPPDAAAHLSYRFRFATLFEQHQQPGRAVRLYQQILKDRTLRELPNDLTAAAAEPAGIYAQRRIAALITDHGRSIYSQYEAEAKNWLESGRRSGDEATLERVVDTFPNSEAAPLALVAHGELLARRGDGEDAAKRIAAAYHRYPKQVDRPELLKKIADAYETAGKVEHAYRWLTKAADEYPAARLDYRGRSITFREYRERLAGVRDKVEPSRPSIDPPLDGTFVHEFEEDLSLLTPRFGDEPASRWSRYFVYTPAGIRAFDARTGVEVWSEPAAVRQHPELLIVTSGTAVFATLYEVLALDPVSGARRWSYGRYPKHLDDADGDWEDGEVFRTHSLEGNRLVSVRDNGQMICIALDTGQTVWSQTHRPEPIGRVRIADPWVVYHVVQDGHVVVCLIHASTGAWSDAITTDETRTVEAVFVTLGGRLVVVTSQSVSSYDPESHMRQWRVPLDGHLRRESLLLGLDALYLSDDGRQLKKISLEDGRLLWESQRLIRRSAENMLVRRQQGNLILSTTSSLNAVDAVTGLTVWQGAVPQRPRFVARLLSRSYVIAVDVPGALLAADSVAYFYDHRNASGLIPRDGGAVNLGRLSEVRSILAVDGALLIQTESAVHGWTHK